MLIARTIAVLLALSFAGRTAEPGSGISLNDVISEALVRNPEVLAAAKRYEAAQRRPVREGSLPDPVLSVGYASNGGPLPGQGLGINPTSNVGFMASQEFVSAGKRQLRERLALTDADADYQGLEEVRARIRSQVTQAFHTLHHTYVGLEVLNHGKDLLTRFIEVAEARYSAGKATQQEILKAQTDLALMQTRIVQMEQDQRSAESEINMLLSRDQETRVGKPIEDEPGPIGISLAELLDEAEQKAPGLKRQQILVERGQMSVGLAQKELHPNYTVSAGYFNQGGMAPMFEVRADVPLPVYASRKQRPAIAEQLDFLGEARQNVRAEDQNLRFRIRDSYQVAETSFRLMQLYKDTLLPQSDLTVESSLNAYQTGSANFLSVLTNLVTEVDTQERYHEEMLNYWLALAKLEELVGAPLAKEVRR